MRNCKRFLAALLASMMMFSLAACEGSGSEEKEPVAETAGSAESEDAGNEKAEVKSMDAAELQKIEDDKDKKEECLVIDVRSEEEYKEGHVKFAINMPIDTFADNLASIEEWKDKAVITVCNSGKKSGEAADILVENGFSDVTNAEGVADGGYNLVTWGNIRADELQEAGDAGNIAIVDLRDAADYEAGHFKNAINADPEKMEDAQGELPSDKGAKIITHCYSGNKSAVAAQALVDMGYTNVYNCLDGAKEVEYNFAE